MQVWRLRFGVVARFQCFYVLTLYISVDLRAELSAVHPPVCPACYTLKLALNLVDLTFWPVNKCELHPAWRCARQAVWDVVATEREHQREDARHYPAFRQSHGAFQRASHSAADTVHRRTDHCRYASTNTSTVTLERNETLVGGVVC